MNPCFHQGKAFTWEVKIPVQSRDSPYPLQGWAELALAYKLLSSVDRGDARWYQTSPSLEITHCLTGGLETSGTQ